MKRKRAHDDGHDGDTGQRRLRPRGACIARQARPLTPDSAAASCSPKIIEYSSFLSLGTPPSSCGAPTPFDLTLASERKTNADVAPAVPASATPNGGYLSIHNSELPTPYCHVYVDAYDHEFGKKVCARFAASEVRDAWRREEYGAEIADTWKRGSTPQYAREQARAKAAAISYDWSSDDEEADLAWRSTRDEKRRISRIKRGPRTPAQAGAKMTAGRRDSGGTARILSLAQNPYT